MCVVWTESPFCQTGNTAPPWSPWNQLDIPTVTKNVGSNLFLDTLVQVVGWYNLYENELKDNYMCVTGSVGIRGSYAVVSSVSSARERKKYCSKYSSFLLNAFVSIVLSEITKHRSRSLAYSKSNLRSSHCIFSRRDHLLILTPYDSMSYLEVIHFLVLIATPVPQVRLQGP